MSVAQWNVDGYHRHIDDLECLISKESADMLSLQESHFLSNKLTPLHGYNTFRRDSPREVVMLT